MLFFCACCMQVLSNDTRLRLVYQSWCTQSTPNRKGVMLWILGLCVFVVNLQHAHCIDSSSSYRHSNVKGIHEQGLSSKIKASKYHPRPAAYHMHPPPAPAHLSHPPSPIMSPFTKPPSPKPGQAPLAVVESDAGFTLYHGRNFKVIQNLFYNLTYLLLQQAGDSNEKDWILSISVLPDPLMNFTLNTSSAVGFLELLGCVAKLKGVPVSFGLASPCISQLILQGEIPTVGIDNNSVDDNMTSSAKSFEALFGSSNNVLPSGKEQNQSYYVSFDSSIDRGPLQRAEWIKFLASFFDMEERANSVYDKIQGNYQCLNASSKGKNMSKPLVAWLTYVTDLGVWAFSNDPYKRQLNLDAGGLNLDSNFSVSFNMSIQMNVEDFHTIASTLDVVIDETYISDPSAYTWDNFTKSANITDLSGFPFLANKRLWRYDKRIGINNALDWMESGIAQPQIVLRDLIEVFYPPLTDDQRSYNITYFRNIAIGESFVNTTTSVCPRADMTSALEPFIIPCTNNSHS